MSQELENRLHDFGKKVRDFCRKAKWDIINVEYIRQVIRSSGSVGANYIEANESFSAKDFLLRIKICRKEAKETIYWLKPLGNTTSSFKKGFID